MRKFAVMGLMTLVLSTVMLWWYGYRSLREVVYLGREGVFLQRSSYDCGDAALKMIFDHHQIAIAYDELLARLGNSPAGASMLSMKQLSEAKGLRCEGWRLKFEDLRRAPLPAILLLNRNHYVVLDSFTASGEPLLRDPARGRLRLSPRKLRSIWKGDTLLFGSSR